METKVLNFIDAMKLASIISKYISHSYIEENHTVLEFIDLIISNISPQEYGEVLSIITGEPVYKVYEKLEKDGGKVILSIFISGLEKNKILLLLNSFSAIGFK